MHGSVGCWFVKCGKYFGRCDEDNRAPKKPNKGKNLGKQSTPFLSSKNLKTDSISSIHILVN